MKKALSLALAIMLALSMALPAMAASSYADVPEGAWYAEAAETLKEKNLMNGVGGDRFAPELTLTRATIATVLYRAAGEPDVTGEDAFTDTESGAWYSNAVIWASQQGIVGGYGNGKFGTNDPVTQEQAATMLWRSAGSYVIGGKSAYETSSYAADAVYWAEQEGLLTDAVAFVPKENATRAQIADMVYRYLTLLEKFANVDAVSGATQKAEEPSGEQGKAEASGKILIAYFSRAGENYSVGVIDEGNTAKLAKEIAAQTGGTLFEIIPATAYPNSYEETKTIATRERTNNERPAIRDTVKDFAEYDTIFIGYPVWWGDTPMILHTFMEAYDFTGKTVVPFNTHEGSGSAGQSTITGKLSTAMALRGYSMLGSEAQKLTEPYGSNPSVRTWLDGLGLLK